MGPRCQLHPPGQASTVLGARRTSCRDRAAHSQAQSRLLESPSRSRGEGRGRERPAAAPKATEARVGHPGRGAAPPSSKPAPSRFQCPPAQQAALFSSSGVPLLFQGPSAPGRAGQGDFLLGLTGQCRGHSECPNPLSPLRHPGSSPKKGQWQDTLVATLVVAGRAEAGRLSAPSTGPEPAPPH